MSQNFIVESVEVVFSATHPHRGDLRLTLTSPVGTQSVLAETHDDWNAHYSAWTLTSARHWGELSAGSWQIQWRMELQRMRAPSTVGG